MRPISIAFTFLVVIACGGKPGDTVLDPDGGEVDGSVELVIAPQDPTLDVSGSPDSLAFTSSVGGVAVTSSWQLDDVKIGVIDAGGTFRSQGLVAGIAKVTARYGTLEASTTVRVRVRIVDNTAGLPMDQITALDAGGNADPDFSWLYPYDATVFPRGIPAPNFQYKGGDATAMRIAVDVGDFSYVGYFASSSPAAVRLPDAIWKAATRSAGGADPFVVEATKLVGTNQVTGPIGETYRIGQADLKGVVYYNTYKSALTNTGAIMRLKPGHAAEVMIGGCAVCHSVSANGNVVAAGVGWSSSNPIDSKTFTLDPTGAVVERVADTEGRRYSFGALTPDGSLLLSNAVPSSGSSIRGLSGATPSKLYNTSTGAEIVAPTFSTQVSYAMTPAFAPDGKHIAFNWSDAPSGTGGGKTLAMMDVDLTMTPPMFGTVDPLVTLSSGVAGWPSFLPDGAAVVYHQGERFDTNGGEGVPGYAEVKLVDTATKTVNPLYALNGRDASGISYLPYGEDEENRRNYEPSVLPVAVGGYYWVMFTSRRAYGHTLAPGGTVAGTDDEWGTQGNPSKRKKIWVAAIDLNYQGAVDPSHPAFYLDGQELDAGNMRAYAALEPCRADGATCESGSDCCGGFCRPTGTDPDGQPILQCVPPPGGCSNPDETCTTPADCCGVATGATCVNNRCAAPPIF
ncbi:MAG: TolB family protein [Kofleriaceae bacterium]